MAYAILADLLHRRLPVNEIDKQQAKHDLERLHNEMADRIGKMSRQEVLDFVTRLNKVVKRLTK